MLKVKKTKTPAKCGGFLCANVCVRVALDNFAQIDTSLTVENVIFAAERLSSVLAISVKIDHLKVEVIKRATRKILTMTEPKTITINDKEYILDELSDAAKAQLGSLQLTDQEIIRLQQQLAIAQTARNAYAQALNEELPKDA